jgi:hypothetical protein
VGAVIPPKIGRAVLVVSTDAIAPSTRQCAGTAPAASIHAGDSVTPRTGSPMADGSIDVPTLAAVQSDAVIVMSAPSDLSAPTGDAGACASAAITR